MSEKTVGLNIQIPKSIHEKAKEDARQNGQHLKDHIIALIQNGSSTAENDRAEELIELLLRRRDSKRFGPETILEEILRRIISIQIQNVDGLRVEVGKDEIQDKIDRYDSMTEQVVNRS